jgi:hypothetical protein
MKMVAIPEPELVVVLLQVLVLSVSDVVPRSRDLKVDRITKPHVESDIRQQSRVDGTFEFGGTFRRETDHVESNIRQESRVDGTFEFGDNSHFEPCSS